MIVGLIVASLTYSVMGSGGTNILSDLIVGIIGALVGGFVLSFFNGTTGIVLSIVVFIGACLLTWIVRTVVGNQSPV